MNQLYRRHPEYATAMPVRSPEGNGTVMLVQACDESGQPIDEGHIIITHEDFGRNYEPVRRRVTKKPAGKPSRARRPAAAAPPAAPAIDPATVNIPPGKANADELKPRRQRRAAAAPPAQPSLGDQLAAEAAAHNGATGIASETVDDPIDALLNIKR